MEKKEFKEEQYDKFFQKAFDPINQQTCLKVWNDLKKIREKLSPADKKELLKLEQQEGCELLPHAAIVKFYQDQQRIDMIFE